MTVKNNATFTVKMRCGKRTKPSVDVGGFPCEGKSLLVGDNLYGVEDIGKCIHILLSEWLKDQIHKNTIGQGQQAAEGAVT